MVTRFLAIFALAALPASAVSAAPGAGRTPPLGWVFQMRRNPLGDPDTNVFLRVGGRQVLVLPHAPDEFHLLAKTDYKDQGIPASALSACFGWWGGAGDNLYVVRRGRSLMVYRQEADEQAPTFPWKRLKVIPLR